MHLRHVQGPYPVASRRSGGYRIFCVRCVSSTHVSHTHPVFREFFAYAYSVKSARVGGLFTSSPDRVSTNQFLA